MPKSFIAKRYHGLHGLTLPVFFRSVGFLFIAFTLPGMPAAMSGQPGKIPAAPETVTENLVKTISQLQANGGRTTWEQQSRAAEWIENEFQSLGVEARFETYEYDGRTWKNVVAEIKGKKEPDRCVVVMAHLDTRRSDPQHENPGADDNGSGIAVLLEIARGLSAAPLDRTVLFCIFSNEEPGAIGSRNFARDARKNGLAITAAVNFDTLGYNSDSFAWDSVLSKDGLNYKLKAFLPAAENYWTGLFNGKRAIRIAGRPSNAGLVQTVSASFSRHTSLQVKPLVRNDSG